MAIYSNLTVDQGSNFLEYIDVTDSSGNPLNLAGYTVAGQIRKTYSSSTVAATFGTSLSAATGQITLTLTDTVTGGMSSGRYVYDIIITDSSGDKTRILEGQATITPSVSRT